jgi:hypothetical protein
VVSKPKKKSKAALAEEKDKMEIVEKNIEEDIADHEKMLAEASKKRKRESTKSAIFVRNSLFRVSETTQDENGPSQANVAAVEREDADSEQTPGGLTDEVLF